MSATERYHGHRNYGENDEGDSHIQKGLWQPDIIVQPMGFASPPISIPGKDVGSIFRGKKKYHGPFHLTHTYLGRPITSPFVRLQIPRERRPRIQRREAGK